MAIAKAGGTPERLVESETSVLTPLGISPAGRMFVISSDSFLEEVTSAGTLERVANVPALDGNRIQLVDSQVYWASHDSETQQTFVFATT